MDPIVSTWGDVNVVNMEVPEAGKVRTVTGHKEPGGEVVDIVDWGDVATAEEAMLPLLVAATAPTDLRRMSNWSN